MTNQSATDKKLERVEEILANRLERRTTSMLENHFQTLIVFIILGVMSWVGYSINQTNVSVEVLKNDVSYMKAALDKASSTHVNINEYIIAKEAMQKEVSDAKARIRLLEQKSLNKIKGK